MRKISIIIFLVAMMNQLHAQGFAFAPKGKVHVQSMTSEVLGVERNYSVYLPKSYETDENRQYPILYLLHGVMDTHMGWVQRGHLEDVANQLVASEEACELIVVVPDAGSEWNGYFDMDGWAYETFFFSEFMPFIEHTYRVKKGKEYRAIAGLSMGGGGATVYAQKHPELFSSVYAISALMSLPFAEGPPAEDPRMEQLNKAVRANDCVQFLVNASDDVKEQLKGIRWYVDCGDDDFLLNANIAFVQEMNKNRIPLQFRVRDGGHTWEYWHSALYHVLRFVSLGFATQ